MDPLVAFLLGLVVGVGVGVLVAALCCAASRADELGRPTSDPVPPPPLLSDRPQCPQTWPFMGNLLRCRLVAGHEGMHDSVLWSRES